jgi:hypothetical protein
MNVFRWLKWHWRAWKARAQDRACKGCGTAVRRFVPYAVGTLACPVCRAEHCPRCGVLVRGTGSDRARCKACAWFTGQVAP